MTDTQIISAFLRGELSAAGAKAALVTVGYGPEAAESTISTVEAWSSDVKAGWLAQQPTGDTPPPPTDTTLRPQSADELATLYRDRPEFYQGTFEQQMEIPTAGRNPYAKWLAGLGESNALAYALTFAPELQTTTPHPMPTGGGFPTYAEWLSGRKGGQIAQPGLGDVYQLFKGLASPTQDILSERYGEGLSEMLFEAGQRQRMPAFLAKGLTQQTFAPAAQRAYEIAPGTAALKAPTFLDWIRQRYGI